MHDPARMPFSKIAVCIGKAGDSRIYFTADLHFSHDHIIHLANRPYHYIKEMNDAIIREYEKLGLTAAGVTGLGITENTEIGSVTKEQLETLCCSTGAGHGEGIAVVCTNLAAAWRADLIEKRSGAVVFDSVTAAVREALKLCGLEKLSFQGWGKLLDV